MLPTESLILSVLQILSDAAQIGNDLKENTAPPRTIDPNVIAFANDQAFASIGKGFFIFLFTVSI